MPDLIVPCILQSEYELNAFYKRNLSGQDALLSLLLTKPQKTHKCR